jgi:phosphonopyruvate decarboxylase
METILAKAQRNYCVLIFEEGCELDYVRVEQHLSENPDVTHVAFVHMETSTGVLNNLARLRSIAQTHNKKLVVDAIASLGSDLFDFNGIDYLVTSCNKCLQSVPGFTIILVKSFDEYHSQSLVLDLKDQHEHYEKTGQFRFTPPTHALVAFHRALRDLKTETLARRVARFQNIKTRIYARFAQLGIRPLVDDARYTTGNVCHTFLCPSHANFRFDVLYDGLKDHGFLIYPGKVSSVSTFRVGSIGDIDEHRIEQFLNHFEATYASMLQGVERSRVAKIAPLAFCDYLHDVHDVSFYSGVPDSLLQNLNSCIQEHCPNHHITPNEGLALSMACGYYTATRRVPCVYLQNSGLGNMVNPLFPVLVIVGWRGEPNVHDEPQHRSQGACMLHLIETMGFEYEILDAMNWKLSLDACFEKLRRRSCPVFLVVKKDLFEKRTHPLVHNGYEMIRRDAIERIVLSTDADDLVCCTTGKASREMDEVTSRHSIDKRRTFLMVGSMGHLSAFCLGLTQQNPRRVYCIDGDGALLMHMGMMPYVGASRPERFVHILLNNAMHESVGTLPTIAQNIRFHDMAKELGYEHAFVSETDDHLCQLLQDIRPLNGCIFVHVMLSNRPSVSDSLSRPTTTPKERLDMLMGYLSKHDGDSTSSHISAHLARPLSHKHGSDN